MAMMCMTFCPAHSTIPPLLLSTPTFTESSTQGHVLPLRMDQPPLAKCLTPLKLQLRVLVGLHLRQRQSRMEHLGMYGGDRLPVITLVEVYRPSTG